MVLIAQNIFGYTLVWLTVFLILLIQIPVMAAEPPYTVDSRTLTLLDGSSTETKVFSTNENVTIQFIDTIQHDFADITLEDYTSSTTYLDKQTMTETDNGDGTYTYSYTFNTNTLLGGVEDWYYFFIDMKVPKASVSANFVVGAAATPHWIKTYSDSSYTTETDEFNMSGTVYVEVVGNDNGNSVSQKKVTITDYDDVKHINGSITNVTLSSGVYRFAVDLFTPSNPFTENWWHSLLIQLKQSGSGDQSFIGYKQIKILPAAPDGARKWVQQKWRELD